MARTRVLRTEADKLTEKRLSGISIPFLRDRDLAGVSRVNLERWIRMLRDQETQLRRLRKRLEALQAGDVRTCPVCGHPVAGRPDAVYCSDPCRLRAHRASKVATDTAVSAGDAEAARRDPFRA